MRGLKHLRGVGTKEQRQYEHIKESAQRSGRYGQRPFPSRPFHRRYGSTQASVGRSRSRFSL